MQRYFALLFIIILACSGYGNAEAAQKATIFQFLLNKQRTSSTSLANGKVYFYSAGTTTAKTVWIDRNKATTAANPYALDANGTTQIYGDGLYRIIIKDSGGVTRYDRDNISVIDVLSAGVERRNSDFTSLNDAITQIGNTQTTLTISTANFPVTASVSIPSTLTLNFVYPGSLSVGGYTVIGLTEDRPEWFSTNTIPGTTDMTAAIQSAINAAPSIKLSDTTYLISSVTIPTNKTIITAGLSTVIKQHSGQAAGTRIINVAGSNVVIGDMTLQGNIATDTGEQYHGVIVKATSTTGPIDNIRIGNLKGADIRGDVLYLGANAGYPLTNVHADSITGDNVLRNVVSIVGGRKIDIYSVTGSRVGLYTFDIEPEPYSENVTRVHVGYIKGRAAGVAGTTSTSYADGVAIDYLDLDHASVADCSPSYGHYPSADAFTLRNVKSIHIGTFKATGYNRSALYTVYNAGEIGVKNLTIDYAETSNNSLTDTKYNTHFLLSNVAHPIINSGSFSCLVANKSIFGNFTRLEVNNFTAELDNSAAFTRNGTNANIRNGVITGAGILVAHGTNHNIKNVTFTGTSLTSYSNKCLFDGVTATTTGTLFSNGDDHIIHNTTLNTVYFATGP